MLSNMPSLKELNINRMYTHQIKSQASTVTSFVQCVSRLPSLVTVQMWGWLLDEEDFKMFNTMKEQHPQSKSLKLCWQWSLPFSPILQEWKKSKSWAVNRNCGNHCIFSSALKRCKHYSIFACIIFSSLLWNIFWVLCSAYINIWEVPFMYSAGGINRRFKKLKLSSSLLQI